MSTKPSKSIRYKKSSRVRTISHLFDSDRLCRYLLSGNRRCRSVASRTGSGLCMVHDRHVTQLRDAESLALGTEALGQVTDFNSAISIHAVLSRVVILGLKRRYTTKEVAVFTYAIQALRQTLGEAAYDIRDYLGHNSRDTYIQRALRAEPSLRQPRQRSAPAATEIVEPSNSKNSITADAADIADILETGHISGKSRESAETLLRLSPVQNVPSESVGAGLGRDSGQALPSPDEPQIPPPTTPRIPAPQPTEPNSHPTVSPTPKRQFNRNNSIFRKNLNSPADQDPDDGSIPFTHQQTYGGVTVPLHGRLRKIP